MKVLVLAGKAYLFTPQSIPFRVEKHSFLQPEWPFGRIDDVAGGTIVAFQLEQTVFRVVVFET